MMSQRRISPPREVVAGPGRAPAQMSPQVAPGPDAREQCIACLAFRPRVLSLYFFAFRQVGQLKVLSRPQPRAITIAGLATEPQ